MHHLEEGGHMVEHQQNLVVLSLFPHLVRLLNQEEHHWEKQLVESQVNHWEIPQDQGECHLELSLFPHLVRLLDQEEHHLEQRLVESQVIHWEISQDQERLQGIH